MGTMDTPTSCPLSVLTCTLEIRAAGLTPGRARSLAGDAYHILRDGILQMGSGAPPVFYPIRWVQMDPARVDVSDIMKIEREPDGTPILACWYDVTLLVAGHVYLLGKSRRHVLPVERPYTVAVTLRIRDNMHPPTGGGVVLPEEPRRPDDDD